MKRISVLIMSVLIGSAMGTRAVTVSATPSTDNVLQGNFEQGDPEVFLANNSNARRVGAGGAGTAIRINQPVLGFTLPSITAGESVTEATFSVTMDATAITGSDLEFDMVISIMTQTSIDGFSGEDFIEGTTNVNEMLGNGIVVDQIASSNVANDSVESFELTGAALAHLASLYDGAGNPSQPEIWFRLSSSQTIDTSDTANNSDRFNLARVGEPLLVNRGLELVSGVTGPAEQPIITSVMVRDSNLIFSGTNGVAGGSYVVVDAAGLDSPTTWVPSQTNTFDSAGAFSVTNAIEAGDSQSFYRIEVE